MRLGFWSKLYYAITDFRLYPYVVQKEKFITSFSYFVTLMLIASIVISLGATYRISNWLNEFAVDYNEQICDFDIKDGQLVTQKDINIDYLRVKILSNDKENIDDVDLRLLDLDNYKLAVLAFKDSFAIGNNRYGYFSINYSETNMNLNKETTHDLLNNAINSKTFKISMMFSIFTWSFILLILTRLIYTLFITVLLIILGLIFKTNYRFLDYFKISFYIITLPTIVELSAFLYVGELNQYVTSTYYLLCYVYMFYAVRALKLDNILMVTQQKIINMKNEKEEANNIITKDGDSDINQVNNDNNQEANTDKENDEEKIDNEENQDEDKKDSNE